MRRYDIAGALCCKMGQFLVGLVWRTGIQDAAAIKNPPRQDKFSKYIKRAADDTTFCGRLMTEPEGSFSGNNGENT
jgi:hypothetical protein